MKSLIGKTVCFHLTADQQDKAGGNHVRKRDLNFQHAPAVIVRDLNYEDYIMGIEKKFPNLPAEYSHENFESKGVNLKVHTDSRDDIWVQNVLHGKGAGQWEFFDEIEELPIYSPIKQLSEETTLKP